MRNAGVSPLRHAKCAVFGRDDGFWVILCGVFMSFRGAFVVRSWCVRGAFVVRSCGLRDGVVGGVNVVCGGWVLGGVSVRGGG